MIGINGIEVMGGKALLPFVVGNILVVEIWSVMGADLGPENPDPKGALKADIL